MSVKKIQNMRRRGSFETLLLCKTSKVGMHERHFERLGINHVSPNLGQQLSTQRIQPQNFTSNLDHLKVRVRMKHF